MTTSNSDYDRLAAIIGSATDAIISIDEQERIIVFNSAAEQVFRCPASEAIGQPLSKFIPRKFRQAHSQHVRDFGRTGVTQRSMHTPGVVIGLRADGEEFPLEATIAQADAQGQRIYTVILRDISERKAAEGTLNGAEKRAATRAHQALGAHRVELSIAALLQQRLLAITTPDLPFATVRGRVLPCKHIGGDFFSVVPTAEGVAVAVTDGCGKGISAALLASIFQGMIYSEFREGAPLAEIAQTANQFLCQKQLGADKFITAVLAYLSPGGELEFVNCGHLSPLLLSGGKVVSLEERNLPLGMLPEATYRSDRRQLLRGDRLVVVTDGVTEAEDSAGNTFGNDRLWKAAASNTALDEIFASLLIFRGDTPLRDDCTVLELTYTG